MASDKEWRARRASRWLHRSPGFTLVELMLALAVVALLLAIAVPSYSSHVLRSRTAAAIGDIGRIQLAIDSYRLNTGQYPPDLATVNKGDLRDPWGRPYVYLRLNGNGTLGAARKDKNLVPINSDYDLYSLGPDGRSQSPLTSANSRDDIVRANDGNYIGLASKY